jgi:hypothetical protein
MGPTTNVGTSIKYLYTYRSPEAGARKMHLPRHPILVVSVYGHVQLLKTTVSMSMSMSNSVHVQLLKTAMDHFKIHPHQICGS